MTSSTFRTTGQSARARNRPLPQPPRSHGKHVPFLQCHRIPHRLRDPAVRPVGLHVLRQQRAASERRASTFHPRTPTTLTIQPSRPIVIAATVSPTSF